MSPEPENRVRDGLIQRFKEAGGKPISRRAFLGFLGVGAAAYIAQDDSDAERAVSRQFELSPQFREALQFMVNLELTLPQDTLFGFVFPSPREMAESFIEKLQHTLIDPENPQLYVVQETPVVQWTRRIRQFLNIEPKNHCSVDAVVYLRESKDQPDWMYLPEDFPNRSKAEQVISLYHEGLHLFDPEADHSEDKFKRENKATIGTILLEKVLMAQKKQVLLPSSLDLSRGYEEAVAKNNPEIWKEALLNLTREVSGEVQRTPLCR